MIRFDTTDVDVLAVGSTFNFNDAIVVNFFNCIGSFRWMGHLCNNVVVSLTKNENYITGFVGMTKTVLIFYFVAFNGIFPLQLLDEFPIRDVLRLYDHVPKKTNCPGE